MRTPLAALIFITLSFFSSLAHAVDPRLNWHSFETDHFYIHFADGYKTLAEEAAAYGEQAHKKISRALNWQPQDKTHLVISDESDQANGMAEPLAFNRSVIFVVAPDEANSLEDTKHWLQTLITHEYTHIIHLDKAAGLVKTGRSILGRNFYLFPNVFQPPWMIEGLATYFETDKAAGVGRGQSSFFRMMMRMEVEQGIKPLDQVNLPLRSWPLGTSYYLYGVYFYQFLNARYGEPIIESLVENYSDNLLPFFINTNAEKVLDKNLTELWQEFEIWLKEDFETELKRIRQQKRSGKKLTDDGYFRTQLRFLPDGRYYYIRSDAYQHQALIEVSADNKILSVVDINPGARIDVHPQQGVLISQLEFCDEYNRYYDLSILKPGKNKIQRLTYCGRYPSAAWTDDGQNIIAVHLEKSRYELQQLDNQAQPVKTLWRANHHQVVGQPDVSADNKKILASVFREKSGWNIEEFNLQTAVWESITDDTFIDMYPQYASKGQTVLFSSDRDGVFNIYQWQRHDRHLRRLTNVEGGAFKPVFNKDQTKLFYESYSAKGYDLSVLDTGSTVDYVQHKSGENAIAPAAKKPKTAFVHAANIEDYSPWKSLRPRWWMPIIRASNQQTETGFQTSGNDALGVHQYFMELSLSQLDVDNIRSNRGSGFFNYAYASRFVAGVQRRQSVLLNNDPAQFNGEPVAIASRLQDEVFAAFIYSWPGVESSVRVTAGVKLNRDRIGQQLPGIGVADFDDDLVGVSLKYWDFKNYARSISSVDGSNIRLSLETSDPGDSFFSGEILTLDARHYMRLGLQQVLALRFVQGWGTQQPRPFELGGEGVSLNPLSILSPVATEGGQLGQRSFPLRGYGAGLPQLRGRRMQLLSAEWRFPVGDLIERGWMAPPLGLIQASGRLFVDSGAAWNEGSKTGKYFKGVGAELMLEVNGFYGLSINWRLGYARGLDEQLGDELIYLSLGGAF